MSATIEPFDASLHRDTSVSAQGICAQSGKDTCSNPAVFSVIGEHFRIAACDEHVAGAARQALGLPPRR